MEARPRARRGDILALLRAPDDSTGTAHAWWTMSVLFTMAGLFTLGTVFLPTPPGFHTAGVVLVAVAACTAGSGALVLSRARGPAWLQELALAGAFPLIAVHNLAGGVDPFRYGMFLTLPFVWIGLHRGRGSSLRYAPLAVLAYLIPLMMTDATASDYASISYAVLIYLTIGEVLSHTTGRLRDLQTRLRWLAERDPLTGLANRGVFTKALTAACARPVGAAVVFVDLDGFKAINDRHGHAAGDRVLIDVATALTEVVRQPPDLACRLAGDEFVALIAGPDPAVAAAGVADRIAARLAEIRCPDGVPISASLGVAAGTAAESLLATADAAMYEAKRQGKGRVVSRLDAGSTAEPRGERPPTAAA